MRQLLCARCPVHGVAVCACATCLACDSDGQFIDLGVPELFCRGCLRLWLRRLGAGRW